MTHTRIASALVCLVCLACLILSGCAGVAPSLPGETDIRREISERPFWTEAVRVAALSGTDEPAPAVHWLCDKRTTVTYNGSNFTTFQVTRVRTAILNSEKAEEYADITIPTSHSRPVRHLYARTIRKDGSYVEVLPSDIHEQSRFPGYALYTDLREKVFAMPAFEDSCVIEYEYARTISGPDLEDHFIMSDRIPVRRAHYSFSIPSEVVAYGVDVGFRTNGQIAQPQRLHPSTAEGEMTMLVWDHNDIPAVCDEEFTPPYRDLATRVSIAHEKSPDIDRYTWGMLGEDYHEAEIAPLLGDRELSKLRDTAERWSNGANGDPERIEAICREVVERTRYVAVGLEGMGWSPRPPQEVIETKYGDCKDMTMLAVTLLRSLDIGAAPALLMTRNLGILDTTLVMPSTMNHMILATELNRRRCWVDLTAGALMLGALPSADRGAWALVLLDDGPRFERIPSRTPEESTISTALTATIDENGVARGRMIDTYNGDLALAQRALVRSSTGDEVKEILEARLLEVCPHAELLDWSYEPNATESSCSIEMEFEAENGATFSGDRIILDGRLFSTSGLGQTLPQRDRQNPVMVRQPFRLEQSTVIEVPDGWFVESLPEPTSHACEFGSYERSLSTEGNTIRCESSFELVERWLMKDRYETLRGFINNAERHNAEPVMLVAR